MLSSIGLQKELIDGRMASSRLTVVSARSQAPPRTHEEASDGKVWKGLRQKATRNA